MIGTGGGTRANTRVRWSRVLKIGEKGHGELGKRARDNMTTRRTCVGLLHRGREKKCVGLGGSNQRSDWEPVTWQTGQKDGAVEERGGGVVVVVVVVLETAENDVFVHTAQIQTGLD